MNGAVNKDDYSDKEGKEVGVSWDDDFDFSSEEVEGGFFWEGSSDMSLREIVLAENVETGWTFGEVD